MTRQVYLNFNIMINVATMFVSTGTNFFRLNVLFWILPVAASVIRCSVGWCDWGMERWHVDEPIVLLQLTASRGTSRRWLSVNSYCEEVCFVKFIGDHWQVLENIFVVLIHVYLLPIWALFMACANLVNEDGITWCFHGTTKWGRQSTPAWWWCLASCVVIGCIFPFLTSIWIWIC